MLAIGSALLSAIGFAGAAVTSKRGLAQSNTLGGLAISLPSGLLVLGVAAIISWPQGLTWDILPLLVLAGLLGSALGRLFMIAGLSRLNSTVQIPVQTSTHPLVSVAGAFLVLGEPVGLLRVLGVLVIISGIWVLTRRGGVSGVSDKGKTDLDGAVWVPNRLVLLLPIGTGILYGASDLTINMAMTKFPHPVFGAAVGLFTACVVWGAAFASSKSLRSRVVIGKGKWWFVLQGILAAAAILCAYQALGSGDLSVVSPIIATQPVWVLILSALLLRDVEAITGAAVVGSVLAVVGTIIVGVS